MKIYSVIIESTNDSTPLLLNKLFASYDEASEYFENFYKEIINSYSKKKNIIYIKETDMFEIYLDKKFGNSYIAGTLNVEDLIIDSLYDRIKPIVEKVIEKDKKYIIDKKPNIIDETINKVIEDEQLQQKIEEIAKYSIIKSLSDIK